MGYYINPEGASKEDYLADKGELLPGSPSWDEIPDGKVAVCLVDNGFFTAAGIAYSEEELETFKKNDGRPKKWYFLSKEDAKAASSWNG